ncbi:hypothetical protein AVEN_105081-1 [Araneus ventricosus]|uniref:Uncharacterized protein n=1 Tax=Araneus ventricosus TaxID=182803 RepID=A0A4Y2GSQ3_ARAVE|nr:hypothetical protein AVEN_105081-1 [Araneus ventricosus]
MRPGSIIPPHFVAIQDLSIPRETHIALPTLLVAFYRLKRGHHECADEKRVLAPGREYSNGGPISSDSTYLLSREVGPWPVMTIRTPASILELLKRLSFKVPGCLGRREVTPFVIMLLLGLIPFKVGLVGVGLYLSSLCFSICVVTTVVVACVKSCIAVNC